MSLIEVRVKAPQSGEIGIGVHSNAGLRHIGLIAESVAGTMEVSHLGEDRQFKVGAVPDHWFWVQVDLREHEVEMVCELVHLIIQRKPHAVMRYSFVPPQPGFTMEGEITTIGFTCATYVMGVFETLVFPLIQMETWESRSEDQVEQMAYAMQQADQELRGRLIGEATGIRFRPFEVAGAGTVARPKRPVIFKEAKRLGVRFENAYLALTKSCAERLAAEGQKASQ